MLRKLGRWLLNEPPVDPPSPLQFEPLDGGIAQDADHSTGPVKIEPGLNDFDFPQELLDAEIPDCSQRAEDIVEDLQHYHRYYPSEYQHGHIGYFHPPAEFKEFDEENLWQFFMTNPLDLPPPSLATWQTHRDWRRRALRQLYQLRQISSAQYRLLLETVIACASLMETNNQSGPDYDLSNYQIDQSTIDIHPIPDCSEGSMAIIEEMQKSCEYSSSRFQHGEIGNFIPPPELAEYDADYLGSFPPPIDWTYHRPRTLGGPFSEITAAEPYINSRVKGNIRNW